MGNQQPRIIITPCPRTAEPPRIAGLVARGATPLEQMPKLRELRDDVFSRAEYLYLQSLVGLTGRNIRKACELSGLSRSRLYTLLKKHQIAQPLDDCCRQK